MPALLCQCREVHTMFHTIDSQRQTGAAFLRVFHTFEVLFHTPLPGADTKKAPQKGAISRA